MDAVAHDRHAGDVAADGGGAPAVMVNVPRFLKHPSGHTVYEVDIDTPKTRQVTVVMGVLNVRQVSRYYTAVCCVAG